MSFATHICRTCDYWPHPHVLQEDDQSTDSNERHQDDRGEEHRRFEDWSNQEDRTASRSDRRKQSHAGEDINIKDFIGLKVRLAEVESQLQYQRQEDSHKALVTKLQDAKLSTECENIGLKQKLKHLEQDLLDEQAKATRIQKDMQEEITDLKQQNESLQAEVDRLKQRNVDTDDEGDYAGGYVPFPETSRRRTTSNAPRRRSSFIKVVSTSIETRALSTRRRPRRRSSLLSALRSSLKTSTSSTDSSDLDDCMRNTRNSPKSRTTLDTSDSTRTTKALTPKSSPSNSLDDAWGTRTSELSSSNTSMRMWKDMADEINAQTEQFNRQASDRMRRSESLRRSQSSENLLKNDNDNNIPSRTGLVRMNSDEGPTRTRPTAPKRPGLSRATSELRGPPRFGKPKRRLTPAFGLKPFSSNGEPREALVAPDLEADEVLDVDEFDVKSVLWDNSSDDGDDDRTTSDRTSCTAPVRRLYMKY